MPDIAYQCFPTGLFDICQSGQDLLGRINKNKVFDACKARKVKCEQNKPLIVKVWLARFVKEDHNKVFVTHNVSQLGKSIKISNIFDSNFVKN